MIKKLFLLFYDVVLTIYSGKLLTLLVWQMDYLPIFTKLNDRHCLVVGGGEIALRKIRLLLNAGANVTACALDFHPELVYWSETKKLTLVTGSYQPELLDGAWLVIAATDDLAVNALVYQSANRKDILVNVVDDPVRSSFIMPSIVDRSPIMVAISSGGKAPVLARLIREKLESLLPMHIGKLASISGNFRNRVKQALPSMDARRAYWEKLFGRGEVASLLEKGQQHKALEKMEQGLNNMELKGEVALVGAGPGDPSLLTLKALQVMQQADVVLHDQLVSSEVIELVRRDAERISVGKAAGFHSVPQEETNALLVKFAKQGKKVVRLKGGDPFMFGRGGEELEVLVEHQIEFQVVPGITAASGCSSYAGIPLTHRDYAQSVVFVTGHCRENGNSIEWPSLARENQTVVFYMGLLRSEHIRQKLLSNGRDPETPVAIVSKGTSQQQKTIIGNLAKLPELGQGVAAPALIIVGEVVALADKLAWFNGEQVADPSDNPFLVNLA